MWVAPVTISPEEHHKPPLEFDRKFDRLQAPLMHQLITKIGKGQRGARDLSWDEAKQAARAMIEGDATPHQTGAFLMAMRIKLEGVTELASFTAAARSYVAPITTPAGLNVVDVPVYAEKHNTHHVCLPAAIVAASAGAAILFHGVDNPTVSSDLPRVLAQLGIPVALQGDELAGVLQREGFAYLDLALYHPPLAKLLALREQLGAQNLFHQVARLLNPMRAHSQVVGVAHPPYLEKIPEVVNMIGGRRLLAFQGVEGFPELTMTTPTAMRELRDNRVTRLSLKPEDVRLSTGSFQHMAVASQPTHGSEHASPQDIPAQEADMIKRVLQNQGSRPTASPSVRPERSMSEVEGRSGQVRDRFRDWVVYNAAMFLYAAGEGTLHRRRRASGAKKSGIRRGRAKAGGARVAIGAARRLGADRNGEFPLTPALSLGGRGSQAAQGRARMRHLRQLEDQSVYIFREAYKHFDNLGMLWSMGKDSTVLLWLARKAFFGHVPFPLLHVDTSYKIPAMIEYRDRLAREWRLNLVVGQNKKALAEGMNHEKGRVECCTALKTNGLKILLEEKGYTGIILGVRADEESTRAKERYFSPRDKNNDWDFRDQPPELWDQFKTSFPPNTHIRIHPLLDWTEINIWEYIKLENIPFLDLYLNRGDGTRYRSLGCAPCTFPIKSNATTVDEIIEELRATNVAERSGRAQDEGRGMELLRKDGYM